MERIWIRKIFVITLPIFFRGIWKNRCFQKSWILALFDVSQGKIWLGGHNLCPPNSFKPLYLNFNGLLVKMFGSWGTWFIWVGGHPLYHEADFLGNPLISQTLFNKMRNGMKNIIQRTLYLNQLHHTNYAIYCITKFMVNFYY